MSPVIAISGRLRAGKTTLAVAIAEALRCPRASFGDYVRTIAEHEGIPQDRATLQDLGERLIAEEGLRAFCEHTLARAGTDARDTLLVVEGVRHLDVLTTLRDLFTPTQVVLVYVQAGEESQRIARVRYDAGGDAGLAAVEAHSTEHDAENLLPAAANLTIHASDGAAAACEAVLAWLRAQRLI
jgi:cytidylate kinase